MNADQPVRPANIANIIAINQGRRPLTTGAPSAPALGIETFETRRTAEAVVVDTRSTAAYAAGHLPGAYHVHLTNAEFEQRVGWLVPPDRPILLVLERSADLARALHALAFVGLDARVEGCLNGGMPAWVAAGRPMAMLPQVTVHELHDRLGAGAGQQTLDVREAAEWRAGHIAGARHLTYKALAARIDALGFAPDDPIAVICEGGVRSSTACSMLEMRGYRNLANVAGGMTAWTAARLPTVVPSGSEADGR